MSALLTAAQTAWLWFKAFALLGLAMQFVQPSVDHADLAIADTAAIFAHAPLRPTLEDEIADVVATESDEASLKTEAVGDSGKSHGPMQLWLRPGLSTVENVGAGIEQLRIAGALCKEHRFADYVAGPSGCTSPRALRLSKHRERLAARILAELTNEEGVAQR
jgi:hypothetical protein